MRIIFNIVIISLVAFRTSATNYYLSNKGSDQQNGTSNSSPWRSLQKLLEVMPQLRPGDSILLERGSTFVGELKITASGMADKEIYIGAYGLGYNPIISGSMEVHNWTLFRGNIWTADCPGCSEEPSNLFMDGQYQPLGRYPNENYMALSCTSGCQTNLTDNQHVFADGYWDGAEVVVKSSRWTLDNLPVTNYFNKTFYFSVGASYPLPNGFGYFIQKHLGTLDKPGEWFFDETSKKIFLYCKSGDNPGNHKVDVSSTNTGLDMQNANFVTIENIAFRYQRLTGIQVRYSNHVSLRNCIVEYSGNNGIEINSCQSPAVENCRIEDSNNNGVEWTDNANGSFVRNFIQRTGLHPGRGASGNGTYIGLIINSKDPQRGKNLFQFNKVDSTGYLGIDFRTGGTTIKNNLVSNFCMTKDDGAGIYTWGNTYGNNMIEGNIVLHGIGCGDGTNDLEHLWVSGIYIDDRSTDITVKNNTVAYCSTNGIYIHNARRVSIHGNTLFANGNQLANRESAQLCIKLDNLVPDGDKKLELQVVDNRFVTTQDGNHCLYLQSEKEQDLNELGIFDQNQYCAPRAEQAIAKFIGHQDFCYAIEEFNFQSWQQGTGSDKSSQFTMVGGARPVSAGPNLIRNGYMTNNTEGWIVWPPQTSIIHDKRKGADGPSLMVQFPPGKNEALLYHAGIGLNRDKWYRLSFSAMGVGKSKIEFVPLMASSPWDALDDYTCFSIDNVFKSYAYFFKPNKSSKDARVNFKSKTAFWIDNVTLSEVVFDTGTGSESMQLVYNASDKSKSFTISEKLRDLKGNQLPDSLILQSFDSIVLIKHQ